MVTPQYSNVMALLQQTPTGANLLQGAFVLNYLTSDPTKAVFAPPDGTMLMYQDPVSGDRFLYTYARSGGWRSVQVA